MTVRSSYFRGPWWQVCDACVACRTGATRYEELHEALMATMAAATVWGPCCKHGHSLQRPACINMPDNIGSTQQGLQQKTPCGLLESADDTLKAQLHWKGQGGPTAPMTCSPYMAHWDPQK